MFMTCSKELQTKQGAGKEQAGSRSLTLHGNLGIGEDPLWGPDGMIHEPSVLRTSFVAVEEKQLHVEFHY